MRFGTWRVSGGGYFRADNLLLFIIQDHEHGNILFIGRIIKSNPNG
jgi:serine protease inhibitor